MSDSPYFPAMVELRHSEAFCGQSRIIHRCWRSPSGNHCGCGVRKIRNQHSRKQVGFGLARGPINRYSRNLPSCSGARHRHRYEERL